MSLSLRACAPWLAAVVLGVAALARAVAEVPIPSHPHEAGVEPPQTAAVELDGRVILRVRGVSGFPADARAAAVN